MDLRIGEKVIFEGHPCWRFLLRFYFLGFGEAVLLYFILSVIISSTFLAVLLTLCYLGGVLVLGFLIRLFTLYKITNRRIWISQGIIARKTQEANMDRVQNVTTSQGVIQRILRFGDVDFDTAGLDQDGSFIFRGVANPQEVVQWVDQAQHAAREEDAKVTAKAFTRSPDGLSGYSESKTS